MDRRDFIKSMLASSSALSLGSLAMQCQSPEKQYNIFPKGNMPRKLWVCDLKGMGLV